MSIVLFTWCACSTFLNFHFFSGCQLIKKCAGDSEFLVLNLIRINLGGINLGELDKNKLGWTAQKKDKAKKLGAVRKPQESIISSPTNFE